MEHREETDVEIPEQLWAVGEGWRPWGKGWCCKDSKPCPVPAAGLSSADLNKTPKCLELEPALDLVS